MNAADVILTPAEISVATAQNLATRITDATGHGHKSHWQVAAQTLIAGLLLYAEATTDASGSDKAAVTKFLTKLEADERQLLWETLMVSSCSSAAGNLAIVKAGRLMLLRSGDEGHSIFVTASRYWINYQLTNPQALQGRKVLPA